MRVQPFEPAYLPQLLELVNLHLGAVVPGWALSGTFLAELGSATAPSPSPTRGSRNG